MRVHEQRDRLRAELARMESEIRWLESRILTKIAAPYGDGSRSDMVNAATDVLPHLRRWAMELADSDLTHQLLDSP